MDNLGKQIGEAWDAFCVNLASSLGCGGDARKADGRDPNSGMPLLQAHANPALAGGSSKSVLSQLATPTQHADAAAGEEDLAAAGEELSLETPAVDRAVFGSSRGKVVQDEKPVGKHLEDEDTGGEEQQSTIQWNGKKWVDHGGENGWSPSKPYQQAHKLSDLVPSLKSMSDLKNPPSVFIHGSSALCLHTRIICLVRSARAFTPLFHVYRTNRRGMRRERSCVTSGLAGSGTHT